MGSTAPLHREALDRLLFESSGSQYPQWLREQLESNERRYGAYIGLSQEFGKALAAFRQTEAKPLEIFVVGFGKHGKSTLVNALLGTDASKVGSLPTTRCFLRFRLTREPSAEAVLSARLIEGMHDWLKPYLSWKQEAPEIFNAQEYHCAVEKIPEILAEEARRCDKERHSYQPAILEIERDLPLFPGAALGEGFRLVDTPGMDQVLAGDSVARTGKPIRDIIDWLSDTPRGRHLNWQYRRCDAVLWCVQAREWQKSDLITLLSHFSRFSRKTLIAVTKSDFITDTGDRARVVAHAIAGLAKHASKVCEVNGKSALSAVLENNAEQRSASGWDRFSDSLKSHVIDCAAGDRNRGRYISLRQNEILLRKSLAGQRQLLEQIRSRLGQDLASMEQARRRHLDRLDDFQESFRGRAEARARVDLRGLRRKDGAVVARGLLSPEALEAEVNSEVRLLLRQAGQDAVAFIESFQPYTLARFDAEGDHAGISLSEKPVVTVPALRHASLHFTSDLEGAGLLSRIFVKVFESADEGQRKDMAHREQALRHFMADLARLCDEVLQSARRGICQIYDPILSELGRIGQRFESHQGVSMDQVCEKLDEALSGWAGRNVYLHSMRRTTTELSS